MACFAASVRAPTAIVTESTAGIATGTAATVRTSANCSGRQQIVAAHDGHREDQDDQRQGDDNEEIADAQDRPLEMADGVSRFDEMHRLAEVRARAGGVDHRADLALADKGTGIDGIAGFSFDGQ